VQAHNLTDEEIRRLGYAALVEKLGAVGAARFVRQYDLSGDDYLTTNKPLDDMTAEEIYAEAVRREGRREKT